MSDIKYLVMGIIFTISLCLVSFILKDKDFFTRYEFFVITLLFAIFSKIKG